MASDANYLAKLSEDLLIDIFLQSSVESLFYAKFACKHWYGLIQNPDFVARHLQYQRSHNKGRHLLQYFGEDPQRYNFVLFDDETLNTFHDIDHLPVKWGHLHMQGNINGVYCFSNKRERIILWNPGLLEIKSVPLPHPHFFPSRRVCEGVMGLGIDPSTQDYKLILFRTFKDETNMYPNKYVTVYNLTNNTWRLLTNCNFHIVEWCVYRNECSSFLNGSCHWWTRYGKVVAFDMAEEKFREVPAPDLSPSFPPGGSLTIYNDKLALMLHWEKYIDIRVMLEEGVWIKHFSTSTISTHFYSEVAIWNDGLFLALDDYRTDSAQMFLFNPNIEGMRAIGPKGKPLCFQAFVYYESLVSLGIGTKFKGKLASLSKISGFLSRSSNPYLYVPMEKD